MGICGQNTLTLYCKMLSEMLKSNLTMAIQVDNSNNSILVQDPVRKNGSSSLCNWDISGHVYLAFTASKPNENIQM